MKRIFLVLILLPIQAAFSGGIDDMVLWRYESPIAAKGQFCLSPIFMCDTGPGILFLHSNPYALNSLNWNYADFKYGFGHWGLFCQFKSYELGNLYRNDLLGLGLACEPINGLGLSSSINLGSQKFGDYGSYSRVDLNLHISYSKRNLAAAFSINRINLKKPYEFKERAEPVLTGAIDLGEGMIFSTGFREQYTGENRWFIKQDINIISDIDLNFGYMNNPNLLQWGLDLSWRKLRLSFEYMAISSLNDTIVIGLSWVKR